MSLDYPESTKEAGAAAGSPSPDPNYEPEEEADMLLDQAEVKAVEELVEVKAESPVYVAPGSSPDYVAPVSKRAGRGVKESQGKDKDPGGVRGQAEATALATFKDPLTPRRRSRAGSEEWRWSQKKGSSEVGSEDGEKEELDNRRVRSASTWTPPRKKSASPRDGGM